MKTNSIVIAATFLSSFLIATSVAAETEGTFCSGVSYTHFDDGTWLVNDNGTESAWGSGYSWQDLYDTYCTS